MAVDQFSWGGSDKRNISVPLGKSAALMWELMFTRSMFATSDMDRQGKILARMGLLVEDNAVVTTETEMLNGLNADTLKNAHRIIETGTMIGKLVIAY